MKGENTMKLLAKRIVNLYIYKSMWSDAVAAVEFIHVCSQAEEVRAYKNLNEHSKFILRFCKWCSNVSGRPVVEMLSLMDDFFEQENYSWEDHIEYV